MPLRDWFRAPRHLLPLFLLAALVPSILLLVIGWRFVEQDRSLELQRSGERIQQTADLVVAALEQVLSATTQSLHSRASTPGLEESADAAVVRLTADRVESLPGDRLAWYPFLAASREAPPHLFLEAEQMEIPRQDYRGAIRLLRELAGSTDPSVRATALVRLARNLVKSGQPDSALTAYAEARAITQAAVAGVPANLLAGWARCGLLEELGRSAQLREESRALYSQLMAGRFRLTRPAYELHRADLRRWAGTAEEPPASENARRLAAAAEWLWDEWRQGRATNRATLSTGGVRFTVLTVVSRGELTALIAGPDYAEHHWLGKLTPLTSRQNLRAVLNAPDDRAVTSIAAKRTAAQTGLPWTLSLEDMSRDAEAERMANRQRLWLTGLGLFALLSIAATYFIARAIARELAVARLQSDFVASVSHEFRTPLTSLSQLTEILLEGRVLGEERRETYYQAMARQTERLRRLVESLLDFGRMEAGVSPYKMELIDACTLVRSVVGQFEQEAARIGYHVELELAGCAAPVAGDRDALTNAFWNLLDNAVKYSPQCRTVWVVADRSPKYLSIRVRDRGLGIPSGEQRDVFRKFIRGSGAKLEGIPGTGIGLAMVRHIVEAHRGEIRLESTPGEGSTFTVLLPLEESCAS